MANETSTSARFYEKYAWIILFGLAVLMSLNTLFIVVRGADPAVFETDTGVQWAVFASDYPSVATLLMLEERLLGTGFLGISLFAAILALLKYRNGERWAWYTLWLFPMVLAVTAVLMYLHEQAYVGVFYVGATVIALAGMLLPIRIFFPESQA